MLRCGFGSSGRSNLRPDIFVAISAALLCGCDAATEPATTTGDTNTTQDADFERMATAGKLLSDLHTYLGSGDAAPRAFTFDRLTFDPGSSVIRPLDQPTIHTLAATLQNHPQVRARIVGFGDGDQSPTSTSSLGLQRASAVTRALAQAGVHPSRLQAAAGREANDQRPAQLIILEK